ncbi:MAG: hypothetical protein CVT93_06335 [Bacteroidetes bacterium HGW-Bacteroidetes-10]|nr:MAG: hypothetical protein CVT93_06335 [Bacteroidetes bacterium HGW-Bacteroidetes-10]
MRIIKNIVAAIALIICGNFAIAQNNHTSLLPADSAYRTGKLENGLTYYIRKAANPAGRAEFFIVHNVGSLQEEDNQRGLAHFLEHMAFNGTKNFPGKKLLNYFGSIGVKFGANINAYTSMERTVYNISAVPVQREVVLDSALLALHDWSHYISCEPAEIEAERGVVREEWRRGDDARTRMNKGIMKFQQTGSRFAERDVIGLPEIINTFSRQTLIDYYHKWYHPGLQAVIVVGDIDPDVIEKKIRARFSSIPKAVNPAKRENYTIPDNKEPIVGYFTDPETKAVSVRVTVKIPNLSQEEMQTRKAIYDEVIRNTFLEMFKVRCQVAQESQDSMFRGAVPVFGKLSYASQTFTTTALPYSAKTIFKSLRGLIEEFERVRMYGFSKEEFDQAIVRVKKGADQNYLRNRKPENRDYVSFAVDHFTRQYPIVKPEDYHKISSEYIKSITHEDVNASLPVILSDNNRVIIFSVPESDKKYLPSQEEIYKMIEEVKSSDLDRFTPVGEKKLTIRKDLPGGKILTERAVSSKELSIKHEKQLDSATEWTLSNGARVIWKEEGATKKYVSMRAFRKGGYMLPYDAKQIKIAESFLSMYTINGFNRLEMQKLGGSKSISVKPSLGYRNVEFTGSYTLKDSVEFWNLLYSYFTAVTADENQIANFKNQLLKNLNTPKGENSIFIDSVSSLKFISQPMKSKLTKEDIAAINSASLTTMYNNLFAGADGFTFVFSGPIPASKAKELIVKYIGSLEKGATVAEKQLAHKEPVKRKGEVSLRYKAKNMLSSKASVGRIYFGEVPYNAQSNMYSKFIAYILRDRYMKSIREEKGGTYHVGVTNDIMKYPNEQVEFSVDFDTDPALVDELLVIVQQEIDNFVKNGPTEKEMKEISLYLQKVYQDRKEEILWPAIIANSIKGEVSLQDTEKVFLPKVKADDIKKFAKKIFTSGNRMTFVFEPEKK